LKRSKAILHKGLQAMEIGKGMNGKGMGRRKVEILIIVCNLTMFRVYAAPDRLKAELRTNWVKTKSVVSSIPLPFIPLPNFQDSG